MRRPVQCEGIERGPRRGIQIGVAGAVQPQLFGFPLGSLNSYLDTSLSNIAKYIIT